MFRRNNDDKIEFQKLNELIISSGNILKIMQIFLLIIGIYAITLIFEKWGILAFIFSILRILTPFFIGFIIAWLLNPFVNYLQRKDINRVLATIIVYTGLLLFLYIFFDAFIPLFSSQINEFVSTLPNIVDTLKNWIDSILVKIDVGANFDVSSLKTQVFDFIEEYENNITTNLPSLAVQVITSFVSGLGNFAVGLLIGFFMLFDFSKISVTLVKLVPVGIQDDFKMLMGAINKTAKHFVNGVLVMSFIVFIITSLGLYLVGLRAPLLFGLICGITNIIPILGPYIGGFIAVTVGLAQSTTIGVLVLLVIVAIQMVEGELITPLVMSRVMKLHPVTIILSLLIFGHLFGIVGMIIATPIVAIIKILFVFFNDKFKIFSLE